MGVVVDTGVFVLWERRGHSVESRLSEIDRPGFISVVSASELLVGVHRADSLPPRDTQSRFVKGILLQFAILGIDLNVARIHAQLSAELTQKGTTIGYQDLWIAATALNYDYAVITTTAREFSKIPDLEINLIDTTQLTIVLCYIFILGLAVLALATVLSERTGASAKTANWNQPQFFAVTEH